MDIVVYTTPTCPYCHQVKEYLARQGLPFREVDVSQDAAGAAEMVRLTGQRGVPVTVIDGQVVIGFDRPRLDALLAGARRPRLGAAVADAAEMAAKGRCAISRGAYVGQVRPGSPAEQAGLQAGDVIIALAGQAIGNRADLEKLMARLRPGAEVPLEYVRNNERHIIYVRW
jgi:glutaredoxin 3